ncbi:MAG: MaoC family dehydratase [Deltaproteobacteria bacterium]|nr:MAG: MaoC family dehydratase [Deltaproteobacteria bacterium]
MAKAVSVEELKGYIGKEIGISDWLEINQDRINAFADCTEDHQWIHVDKEKARQGPFGTTIAHGYLTLSLLPYFGYQNKIVPSGIKMTINYGLNRLRFINPVPVGSRIRNRAVLKELNDKGEGRILMVTESTIEIEGQDKPAMVAETVSMLFL